MIYSLFFSIIIWNFHRVKVEVWLEYCWKIFFDQFKNFSIPILLVEKRANYSENPWYLTLHYMCLPFVNWHRKELLHRKYIVIYYATSLLNARSVFASDYVSMSVRIWSQSASLPWIKVSWIAGFLYNDCENTLN